MTVLDVADLAAVERLASDAPRVSARLHRLAAHRRSEVSLDAAAECERIAAQASQTEGEIATLAATARNVADARGDHSDIAEAARILAAEHLAAGALGVAAAAGVVVPVARRHLRAVRQ